jgi:hypothetical protein
MSIRRLFTSFVVAAAAYGGLGCTAADELCVSDEAIVGQAVHEMKGEDEEGCGVRGHLLELAHTTITKDALLVEVRLRAGSDGVLHRQRSAPRIRLSRDGCAAHAPRVDGIVDAESDRGSILRVPLAGLPEGHLDLSFTVEGAEIVLLLRKKGADLVLETDAERYPDGNTEIGGVFQPCRRGQ